MSQQTWTAVDDYVKENFICRDDALDHALRQSDEAQLPAISVSAAQGKMLKLLAQSIKAKSILEIGTLGGYSTIWLARALPDDGRLVTLEYEPKHAEVARKKLLFAGLEQKVEVKVGAAADTLPQLVGDSCCPFDLIFIDADKENYCHYFTWSLKLAKKGSLIIADNVVRDGGVIDPGHADSRVQGIRKFNEVVAAEKRVDATVIQTVGSKGYDGFALIYVVS
jgi:predicted O-methyltransferase YrrM